MILAAAKATEREVCQRHMPFRATKAPSQKRPKSCRKCVRSSTPFMKTFRLRRGGVDVVRMYREDSARSDILAVDWSEDIRVRSSVCARKVTGN